jgi:hypothetical protein
LNILACIHLHRNKRLLILKTVPFFSRPEPAFITLSTVPRKLAGPKKIVPFSDNHNSHSHSKTSQKLVKKTSAVPALAGKSGFSEIKNHHQNFAVTTA